MKTGLLLYTGTEPIDLASIGVISMARRVIPELSYITIGEASGPVELANGLRVLLDFDLTSAPPVDVLVVPGGPGWQTASKSKAIQGFLRGLSSDTTICSVCTGAMILAASGLLKGLTATTKFEVIPPEISPLAQLTADFPDTEALKALVIDNGRIITGGGVTLCIDAMLYLLSKRFGQERASHVARIMEYSRALRANHEQLPIIRPEN